MSLIKNFFNKPKFAMLISFTNIVYIDNENNDTCISSVLEEQFVVRVDSSIFQLLYPR